MSRRNQGPRLRWLSKRNVFYITWTEHGRSRKRTTGTADRQQAEKIFGEWLLVRGRRGAPSDPSQALVTEVLTEYATEHGPKVVAPRAIGTAMDALTPFWEGKTVADVTLPICERYAQTRQRSASTVRRELSVLRAAINHAYRHGRITRPVSVTLPAKPEPRTRWLTRREAAKLVRAARTEKARLYMPLFILLGLYTGRRKEAILSLRWPQVDIERGVIDFETPGRARTNKKCGKVRIPKRLLPHLKRARERGTDLGYVLHVNGARIGDIKKGFQAACRRAGLEGVTPHVLRHTTATWLMQAGVPIWEAAGFLAMSERILHDVYAHHHPDYMREAAEAIGRRPGVARNGAQ